MTKLLLFLAVISFSYKTTAQIIYTDVIPDAIISSWNVYSFHLSDTSASYLDTGTVNIWFHPWSPNQVVALTGTFCNIMVNNSIDKLPLKLQKNDPINSTGTWSAVSYIALNIGNTQGLWTGGVTDGYLGIRFKKTAGGNWLYGWARLDVDATPDSFTIKDYAYNSESGSTSILAGQTSNTGVDEKNHFTPSFFYIDPSRNSVVIQFPNPENKKHTLSIFNINGQLIQNFENIYGTEFEANPGNILTGLYIFNLADQNGIMEQREIIYIPVK